MSGYMLNPTHVADAFSGRELVLGAKMLKFHVHVLGDLPLPSGLVAASDPLVCPDPQPFLVRVPKGRYPVDLAVAEVPGGDQRVAFARVRFGQEAPVSWRIAVTDGQDVSGLGEGEFFGYDVDAGTGCFMDPEASRALTARMNSEELYYEEIIAALETTYRHTWSWAAVRPDESRDLSLIAFSTGYGDGVYPSFFGYDEQQRVVCLVTDFGVIPEGDME
jgi:hypothetical protein